MARKGYPDRWAAEEASLLLQEDGPTLAELPQAVSQARGMGVDAMGGWAPQDEDDDEPSFIVKREGDRRDVRYALRRGELASAVCHRSDREGT